MLEQVICEHLQNSSELTELLASYDGHPAVFNYKVPADDDPKWSGEVRYGRIVFSLQLRDDPARVGNSSLSVCILSEKGTQIYKDMEPIVRNCLDGYFFVSDGWIISAKWIHTRPVRGELAAIASGASMSFRIYSYPIPAKLSGNPASVMTNWNNKYVKDVLGQEAYIIGDGTALPATFKPSEAKPAFYWRLTRITPCSWMKETAAADWRTAYVQGHVIIPGHSNAEGDFALAMDRSIESVRRITDDDLSIFVSRSDVVNIAVNSMKTGQLTVAATYGIPAVKLQSSKLQNVSINMK